MNSVEQCPTCGQRKGLRASRCKKCTTKVMRHYITDMCGVSKSLDDPMHGHCQHFIKAVKRPGKRNELAYRRYCACICHKDQPKRLDPTPEDIQALTKPASKLPPALQALYEGRKKATLKQKMQMAAEAVAEESLKKEPWVYIHDLCEVNLHEECPCTAKQCGCQCHVKTTT